MKLESLVPPLELCKLIQPGDFDDTEHKWLTLKGIEAWKDKNS